jgi:hypothetical protein
MRKKKSVIVLALAAFLAAGLSLAIQAEDEGEKVTVQGEILDMACYVGHGAKGPDHAKCAKNCVKGGRPMGLLAKDGTVYLLYASHDEGSPFEQAKEFAGQQVELSGLMASQAGIKGIEVHAVKAL